MDTNNRMIANHPRISITENTSSKNPASCYSVLSTVPYKNTHEDTPVRTPTLKNRQEIPSYDFHYYLKICLSSACTHIFSHPSLKLLTFLKHDNFAT